MRTRFFNLRIPGEGNATEPVELVVSDGRFEEILPAGSATAAGEERWVDLEGALVLPGAIDGHVHFGDPGFTQREDFASGTAAAAAGGVTCVADMPCASMPPVTNAAALENKLKNIGPKAHVDYLLWGGVSGNAISDMLWRQHLSELVDAGAAAIKISMLSGTDTFRDLTSAEIREVLTLTHRLGIPVGVHAEDRTIVDDLTARAKERGDDSPAAYAASRPSAAETSAITVAIDLCRETGARVHVVHIASGEALDVVSAARLENLPISAETCPHYLQFTSADFTSQGSLLKTTPVVKSEADRDRLWQGIASGEVSFVATDHAAGRWPEEKQTGSIWTDHSGVPGVELLLPYLFSEGVCRGRITLQRLTELVSAEPARFFGIDHRKGWLREGYDADFVVVDDQAKSTVEAAALHNLNRYTPFEGLELTGRVRATYVRGCCAFERRPEGTEFFAPSGTGQWVRRGLA